MRLKVIFSILSLIYFGQTIGAIESPKKVELKVPFLCQAPEANWGQPWQDACEEAAIVIAMHYVNNSALDRESGRREILALVRYEIKKYGGHYDLTAEQSARLMTDYYKFNHYSLSYKFTVADMKAELAKGNLIVAPMAGRLLGNKYYQRPGPAYHYLVFKGYDDSTGEFITNDPGTKRGRGYRYKYAVAYNAIHDWAGRKDNIATGRKVMIVVRHS